MTFRNLEKRVERLEDAIGDDESDAETEEYTHDLTEEDYEFLDEMFGGGEWPPENAKNEKEALDEVFGVEPWESQ